MSHKISEVFELANKQTETQKYQKTISIPQRYGYGFFGNIGLEVVFLWNISHQLVTPCALVIIDQLHPEYIWVLPWKLEEEKIEKTISIPVRYRYGFLEILLKTHPNRYVMHLHESNMCSFAEDISKTAKNNKKPNLYHTGIDMVWAKMNKISKNHIYTLMV